MKTLTLHLPDSVDVDDKEALMLLSAKLYEAGKTTLGQSANIVGLSKRAFMEILAHYGVPIFNYSPDDLEEDTSNARNYCI